MHNVTYITSKDEKPIREWSREEMKQWLKSHFPSLPTSFLEMGFNGRQLVPLATPDPFPLSRLIFDDVIRGDLIKLIETQIQNDLQNDLQHHVIDLLQEVRRTCQVSITLKPSEYQFDSSVQSKRFGRFYNGRDLMFFNGKPSPIYTGLFMPYENHFEEAHGKPYVIILGPSGSGKTFTIHQESQKTLMIYIVGNDGKVQEGEGDMSFVVFLGLLQDSSAKQKVQIIWIYIIARLYYLQLYLEKAGDEMVNPIEFFLAQTNDESKKIAGLFRDIYSLFKEYEDLKGLYLIATQILTDLKKYPSVEKFGISIAVDEAGAIEKLLPNEFYSTKTQRLTRGLLTGMTRVIYQLGNEVKKYYFCGTHFGLSQLECLTSPLSKERTCFKYIKASSKSDTYKIWKYYYDMSDVDEKNIARYDFSRTRIIANTVKYINYSEGANKTDILLEALKQSSFNFKNDLMVRLKGAIKENPKIQKAIDELMIVSFYLQNETLSYPLESGSDNTIDLMNLGVVNQYDIGSIHYFDLIHDPLIVEVCEQLSTPNVIVKKIIQHFKESLLIHGIK